MNIKTTLLTFICGLAISTAVIADDHVSAEQRPVEIWTCSFNDGKSMKDLENSVPKKKIKKPES